MRMPVNTAGPGGRPAGPGTLATPANDRPPLLFMLTDMQTNGAAHAPSTVGAKRMIDRQEYIRLMQQALHRLGFHAVAQQLEAQSVRQVAQPSTSGHSRHHGDERCTHASR